MTTTVQSPGAEPADPVDAESVEDPGAGPAPSRALQLALGAVPVIIVALGAWSHRWTSDDGFINYHIVDQVMAGHGPVFNVGERVELGTSPLWLWILVGLRGALGWAVDQAWLGMGAGIAAAASAVALAQLGARWLWPSRARRSSLFLPAGILVMVAIPPFWDFATSGLELGIAFAWLAGCFAGLARRVRTEGQPATRRWHLDGMALLVGLGPLVRPEFAIYTVAFAVVLLWDRPSWRARASVLAQLVAVPLAYELFRMGYYAALVPNTALTKSAGEADWAQGWFYLSDYARAYWLWVPLAVIAALWVPLARATTSAGRRLAFALLLAAVVHVVYVVRLGGDFMHARFLLVPTLALGLPVAAVPVRRARANAAVVAMGVWVLVSLLFLRPEGAIKAVNRPLGKGRFRNHGVIDERRFWMAESGRAHPVTLDDYRDDFRWKLGHRLRGAQERGEDIAYPFVTLARPEPGVSAFWANIGVTGSAAGVDVYIFDSFSLADPVGSRLTTAGPRTRPGHEKELPPAWAEARALQPAPSDSDDVVAARRALACPTLRHLEDDVTAPVTPSQFLHNVARSVPNTLLAVPKDPKAAADELC